MNQLCRALHYFYSQPFCLQTTASIIIIFNKMTAVFSLQPDRIISLFHPVSISKMKSPSKIKYKVCKFLWQGRKVLVRPVTTLSIKLDLSLRPPHCRLCIVLQPSDLLVWSLVWHPGSGQTGQWVGWSVVTPHLTPHLILTSHLIFASPHLLTPHLSPHLTPHPHITPPQTSPRTSSSHHLTYHHLTYHFISNLTSHPISNLTPHLTTPHTSDHHLFLWLYAGPVSGSADCRTVSDIAVQSCDANCVINPGYNCNE